MRVVRDLYFEETIPSGTVGADPAGVLRSAMEARLDAFLSAGSVAWENYQSGVVGAAVPGAVSVSMNVRRSLGDRALAGGAGDVGLFLGIDRRSATQLAFFAMHDWATVGPDPRFASGMATGPFSNLTANTAINFYGAVNSHEGIFIYDQGGPRQLILFGSPFRLFPPPRHRGTGLTAAAVTGGAGNQVIPLDRNLQGRIVVGQNVWMYGQTAAGNSRVANAIEVLAVVAVGPSTITLNPANSYALGARVGLDPSPMYLSTLTTTPQGQFTTDASGTLAAPTWTLAPRTTLSEASVDPGVKGFGYGCRIDLSSGADGNRGAWSLGGAWDGRATPQDRSNNDFNRHDFNDRERFAPFDINVGGDGLKLNIGKFENIIP